MASQPHGANNDMGRTYRLTALRRLLQLVATVMLLAVMVPEAQAVTHGICNRCGGLVVISPGGAGLHRDWKGFCKRCKILEGFDELTEEGEDPSDTIERLGFDLSSINGIRYLLFEDGVMIDLRHFLAAADLASSWNSEALADLLGWMVEWRQWAEGSESGHPFGGNEDLQSNRDGADFGDDHVSNESNRSIGQQVVEYLEGKHGEITGIKYVPGPVRDEGIDPDVDRDD